MVTVLAIGHKVHGFKPSQGDGFLRAIKICSTPSFREEVRPKAPHCNILLNLKELCKYERNIS
jgi:hypothetical protein